jgi:hypothetical protein
MYLTHKLEAPITSQLRDEDLDSHCEGLGGPRATNVGFVIDKVEMEQVYSSINRYW